MILLTPHFSKDYPKYILGYWIISWFFLFSFFFFIDMNKISSDGLYFISKPCLEEESSGRYDEHQECIEYGDPEYTPLGDELRGRFKRDGVITGILSLLIGGYAMYEKRKAE